MNPTSSRKVPLLAAILLLTASIASQRLAALPVPTQLTDEQFWQLSTSMSEQDGTFRSDNLLSNELNFQYVIPELLRVARPGRVYMGVGPEQNFTYIAALKPSMAFIVDIRHGNLDVHLMYKALFEMSENRSEFVSKLFSRKQPSNLSTTASATDLFDAYRRQERDKDLFESTLKAVIDHLKIKHAFPLSAGDEEGIKWALSNYFEFGPDIYYNASEVRLAPEIVGADPASGRRGGGGSSVTYADLMTADDGAGVERSYLANEENFKVLKDLQRKNLLVPVVGDFGGPKAIREVGKYLKSVGGMVSTFYLSNVEQYLANDGKTNTFLSNVATLPIDDTSRFISTGAGNRGGGGGGGSMNNSRLRNMFVETQPYAK
jgi:hypothetical protein